MENRADKYIIDVSPEEPDSDRQFRHATLTITELWSIGHILFKEPLKIELSIGKRDGDEHETALAMYDFGLNQYISLTKERNFLHDYAGPNEEMDPLKTVLGTVKFDLMHAFFHYTGDPNYGHLHWALYGNLKDRVEADDDFIFEDYEKTVQLDSGSAPQGKN